MLRFYRNNLAIWRFDRLRPIFDAIRPSKSDRSGVMVRLEPRDMKGSFPGMSGREDRSGIDGVTMQPGESGNGAPPVVPAVAPPVARAPLRDRLKRLAEGPAGMEAMFVIGFLESSFVPVPIEIVLAPVALWQRRRVWWLTTSALAGCMLACVLFYFLGMFFEKTVGQELVALLHLGPQMEAFQADLKERGFWLVASISLFPLPLQVATLGSGMFGYSFSGFFVAILLTRAIRFYGFVALVLLFGPPVMHFFERLHLGWQIAALAASIVVTAGLYAVL